MTFECSHSLCEKCWKEETQRQDKLPKQSKKRKRDPPFKCPECMIVSKKEPMHSRSLEEISRSFAVIKAKFDKEEKEQAERAQAESANGEKDNEVEVLDSGEMGECAAEDDAESQANSSIASKTQKTATSEAESSDRSRSKSSDSTRASRVKPSLRYGDSSARSPKRPRVRKNPYAVSARNDAKKQKVNAPPKEATEPQSGQAAQPLRRSASSGSRPSSSSNAHNQTSSPSPLRRSQSSSASTRSENRGGQGPLVNVNLILERSERNEKIGAKISAKNPRAHHSYISFQGVEKDKPAWRSGIREHDHIVKVNGTVVNGYKDFHKIVSLLVTHLRVRLVVKRHMTPENASIVNQGQVQQATTS